MPLPPFDMLTFSGVFGAAASPFEDWSWTVKLEGGTPNTVNNEAAWAFAARERYATHLAPLFGSEIVLMRTRFSRHAAGGLVERNADGGYVQGDDDTQVPGTATSFVRYPLQTACVVSLVTPRAGASGKGRCFLPFTSHALSSDYRLTTTNQGAIAAQFKAFLDSIAAGFTTRPVVASSKGFRSPVTAIRVGRTLDTQRSRRTDLLEGYDERALA